MEYCQEEDETPVLKYTETNIYHCVSLSIYKKQVSLLLKLL